MPGWEIHHPHPLVKIAHSDTRCTRCKWPNMAETVLQLDFKECPGRLALPGWMVGRNLKRLFGVGYQTGQNSLAEHGFS